MSDCEKAIGRVGDGISAVLVAIVRNCDGQSPVFG